MTDQQLIRFCPTLPGFNLVALLCVSTWKLVKVVSCLHKSMKSQVHLFLYLYLVSLSGLTAQSCRRMRCIFQFWHVFQNDLTSCSFKRLQNLKTNVSLIGQLLLIHSSTSYALVLFIKGTLWKNGSKYKTSRLWYLFYMFISYIKLDKISVSVDMNKLHF